MSDLFNKAVAVRSGEELDLERLNPWLLERVAGLTGLPKVTQYSGGASNWTYCLSYPEREVILRRAPAGTKARGAHDMGREYRLQAALKPHYAYVPEMLAHSDDEAIIGAEFYVMEKLDGVVPRQNFPQGFDLSAAQARQLCFNAVDSLLQLHKVDYQAAGLDQLAKGAGYIERQVEGWIKRYENVVTWNVPSGKSVARWLRENMPKEELICLTHNDFRLDNMVLDPDDPTNILGVLDWELATLGDPLLDLGTMLVYWIQSDDNVIAKGTRRQPTHLPGMLTREEVLNYYRSKAEWPLENFTFYEVLSSYRLAGIAQQIYYRYHKKQTTNPQFKNIWVLVNYLLYRCRKLIRRRLDMATITLIRHGQASFGAENYDQLSPLGEQQAELLGKRFSSRNQRFDLVLLGAMERHRQTAELCLQQMGESLGSIPNEINPGWNEYDHQNILAQYESELATAAGTKAWVARQPQPAVAFEAAFNGAVSQWIEHSGDEIGSDNHDYSESWASYKARINDAYQQALSLTAEHKQIAVFTSGGPIALLAQALLGVPESHLMKMNWTLINCGLTKIVSTSSRQFIASLNDHSHFEGVEPQLITYK